MEKLENDLNELEVKLRIRGGSLLIVWEGDREVLRESLGRREGQEKEKEKEKRGGKGVEEDADMKLLREGERHDSDSESESDSDSFSVKTSTSSGTALPHTLVPFEVRLIDFAHVSLVREEEGPDEGVLKGVKNLRLLLEGILESVLSQEEDETGRTAV